MCLAKPCFQWHMLARWKLCTLKDTITGPQVSIDGLTIQDSRKCFIFWITSCRAVTNLFKGSRKSIWTLFSAGRRKCKSRIGNGQKERSRRKKITIGSQKATQYWLEELCVSNKEVRFHKEHLPPKTGGKGKQSAGHPLGFGGGGPFIKGKRPNFSVWWITFYLHIFTYYIFTYIFIYVFVFTCIYMYLHVFRCIYMYLHVFTCIYMYLHVFTCIYMYLHVFTWIYLYLHVFTYSYIYHMFFTKWYVWDQNKSALETKWGELMVQACPWWLDVRGTFEC